MIKTPIGTISDTRRGKMIKIAPHSWCSYAKFVWERAHNEKLPVGTSFVFMDGNKNNYDVNNLYPLARKHIIVKQSITYPTTKDEMDTRCLIADLHAKKNAVEIEIYGGSLNVLKKNIMKDPKRLEEYKVKQRERANKNRAKDPETAKMRTKIWYEANKEHVKAKHAEYRINNRDKIRAYDAQYRLDHQEARKASLRKSYEKNKEKYLARKREKRQRLKEL